MLAKRRTIKIHGNEHKAQNDDYGTKVKAVRLKRQWTQADLAKRAMTTQAHIHRIEKGVAPSATLKKQLDSILDLENISSLEALSLSKNKDTGFKDICPDCPRYRSIGGGMADDVEYSIFEPGDHNEY